MFRYDLPIPDDYEPDAVHEAVDEHVKRPAGMKPGNAAYLLGEKVDDGANLELLTYEEIPAATLKKVAAAVAKSSGRASELRAQAAIAWPEIIRSAESWEDLRDKLAEWVETRG